MTDSTVTTTTTVTATPVLVPAALTTAHVSALSRFHSFFEEALADLKAVLADVVTFAPTAAVLADGAAAATGNAELIPVISAADVGLIDLNKTVNSADAAALVTNATALAAQVKATVAATKTPAGAAAASVATAASAAS